MTRRRTKRKGMQKGTARMAGEPATRSHAIGPLGTALAGLMLGASWNLAGAHEIAVAGQISIADMHTISVVFEDELDSSAFHAISISGGIEVAEYSHVPDGPNLLLVELKESTPLVSGEVCTITVEDPAGGAPAQFSFEAFSLEGEVANIRESQLPGGGISTNVSGAPGWNLGDPIRIVPYFACSSAMGLLYAHRLTGDTSLLDDARRYLDWHGDHFEPDGTITDYTGRFPNYSSTGDFDSTDSYGALYLMLQWLYHQETEDFEYLREALPFLELAEQAMDLTYEPDNLTWAKPTYRVKYTMDNAEVVQGYFAAARLAEILGEEEFYSHSIERARLVREAVHSELFVDEPAPGRYGWAKSEGGTIHQGWEWEDYYPHATANEFAIFYTHTGTDPQGIAAWEAHREQFLPGGVPHPRASWAMPASALRMGDDAAFLAAMPRVLENHREWHYAHRSGHLIKLAWLTREVRVRVPEVKGHLAVRADFTDPAWRGAYRMRFHRLGELMGFDNRMTYEYPRASLDPHAVHTIYFLKEGRFLHLGIHARDRFITSAAERIDSDGLAPFSIRDALDPDVYHAIFYTFHPDEGSATIPVPHPAHLFKGENRARTAFEFLDGGNAPNNPDSRDTGYFLHLRIPLDHPSAGALPPGTRRFELGLRIADMDGTPGQEWPWGSGAEGRVMQLSKGTDLATSTSNMAELEAAIPESTSPTSDLWIITGR